MKYISSLIMSFIFTITFFSGGTLNAVSNKKIYYFYAENCESCRKSAAYYKKPDKIQDGNSWKYDDITIIPFRIVDGDNMIVRRNLDILINMCEGIKKKSGKNGFVYFDRDTYEYYSKNGLPYYMKEDRYARRDEAFPTPVFIIGDRVVLGFNLNLINKALGVLK